ncbi:WecB/TagA/CpsF family glycosyltransferase [Polaribacter septentrionalilitoris]|uniref:WecB/TagA/CpsF family glycosyltransferase n=1 Tax=Polaribacter septentrionalilitoris TaxID=2494657 RepID=UPI001359104B|nr:WecB/TagA/CpsF family glycosyltransferase [Polaribacter septentrionalilitoris]
MKKYFNINFEFNHQKLEEIVEQTANNKKGYCCFIDLNSLVHAYKNEDFMEVLNNAFVNSCDGSYIAMSASKIHKENLKQYIGPEFFEKFIFKPGKHVILGSTPRVYKKIIERVELEGGDKNKLSYLELPFKAVNEFDYISISDTINTIEPNYIWVSLGAPKQEYFMSKLLPFINKGVLLGVGAAINYFSGEIKNIPTWVKKMNLVWVFRAVNEPKKQLKRIPVALSVLPKILKDEKEKLK